MTKGARHPRPTTPETASAATVPPIGTPDITTLMAKGASLPSTPRRATERAIGRTTPSPTPVTNRETANAARLGERPDKRVAALKQATPETTTRFEPRARPILPAAMPPANIAGEDEACRRCRPRLVNRHGAVLEERGHHVAVDDQVDTLANHDRAAREHRAPTDGARHIFQPSASFRMATNLW